MQQVVAIGSISELEVIQIEQSLFKCGYAILVEHIDISPIASTIGRYFLKENSELLLQTRYCLDYELGENNPIAETSFLVAKWLRSEYPDIISPLCLLYKSSDFLFPELDTKLLPGVLMAWNTRTVNLSEYSLL